MLSSNPQPQALPDFRYPEQVFNRLADLEVEFDQLNHQALSIQERMTAILSERSHLRPIAEAYFSKTPAINVSARTSDGTTTYLVTMKDGRIGLCRLLPSYELFQQLTDEEVEALEKRVFIPDEPTKEREGGNEQTIFAKPTNEIQTGKKSKTAPYMFTAKSGNLWLVNKDGCEARWFDKIVDLSLPWAVAQAQYREESLEVYETLSRADKKA